ncbi:MATE family efflux transporter [Spirochaeta lutea]|uniref:Multidrug-efflux transporter n=1 Tax=Spirochaeta lutea TaxID=1480694 RepID=A0A098QYN2_9SPIO|nr:MATE family efflux transporter [Spirochaeta lutea]KGE72769.1 hypothetical protein DC28_05890 [Spirochaeta lutea]
MRPSLTRESLAFSLPIVGELLLMSLLSMVTLSLVGHLGARELSSVGLSAQPVAISLAFFQSISIGATALIARSVGAGRLDQARQVVVQALYLAVAMGLILGVPAWIFARPLVGALGAQADTLDSAAMYMRYMALGMVFQALPTAVTSILRGAGDSRTPMVYNIITNGVNLVLSLVLIHGFFGLPRLGLMGAALGTTLAKMVNTLLAIRALFSGKNPIAIKLSEIRGLNRGIIHRILRVGVSSAAEALAMRVGFLFYSRIIADLGTLSFAAHQIILSTTSFGSNLVQGLSAGAASLTGRSLGAENPGLARGYTRSLARVGLGASLAMGLVFFFWGGEVARLFTEDPGVISLTGRVLRIAALITLPQNFLAVLSGALRGAGDTRWPLVAALTGMISARIGLSFVFVLVFRWGLEGAWLAALADQSIRALVILGRYRGGRWQSMEV